MSLAVGPVTLLAVSAPPHSTSQGGAQGARPFQPAGRRGRYAD